MTQNGNPMKGRDVSISSSSLKLSPLFNSINPYKYFGITKAVMDKVYYLPTLIKEARFRHLNENCYVIESATDLRKSGSVGLEYEFIASSPEEAAFILNDYKEKMSGDAQKVWLGFWKMANIKRQFQYGAALTEIMTEIADENRQFHFSTKEKKKFWSCARLLSKTKLVIKCMIKMHKKSQELKIYHSMLDIIAKLSDSGDSTIEVQDYPNDLVVSVLDPQLFNEKSKIATLIANSTLKLHPSEIMMALTLQARGSQRQGQPPMQWVEEDLIDLANLNATALKNKSMARQRLWKKLENLKAMQVVQDFMKEGYLFAIRTENQKKND